MSDPIAHTTTGPVRGREQGGLAVFKGIPYAASTAGDRRFRPPVRPEPWTEPLDAVSASAVAPQNPSMLEQMLGGDAQEVSEDCLRLNVWTPGCDDARRPVMVWIHGGGFETGNGSIPWYDGANLAGRDVVVVTINYRLGCLGYLHLGAFHPDYAGAGNLGLLDQISALEWVRDNIGGFGGDAGNVTVFGESAGAMSIGTLLGTPAAAGLFRRAILQSGAASMIHSAATAEDIARKFLAEVGVEPTDLAALRDVPLEQLLAAQGRIGQSRPMEEGLPWLPVHDGHVLPRRPREAVADGSAAGVELLIGTTLEEMRMFVLMDPSFAVADEDTLRVRSDAFFADHGGTPGEALEVYRSGRADEPAGDVWVAMTTDHTFRIPAIRLVEAQLPHSPNCRMYLFAYRSPAFGGALGSCHALEIPFVWDNLDAQAANLFVGDLTDDLRALSTGLADAWASFARTGEPTSPHLPEWPVYDTDRRATLHLDAGRVEVVHDPMRAERELWARAPDAVG